MGAAVRLAPRIMSLLILSGFLACSDSPEAPQPPSDPAEIVVEPRQGRYAMQLHWSNLLGKHFDDLEAAGFYGNGPTWLGVIEHLAAQPPALHLDETDDESEAVLVTAERATLEALKRRLLAATRDTSTLIDTFRAAQAAGRAPGDL